MKRFWSGYGTSNDVSANVNQNRMISFTQYQVIPTYSHATSYVEINSPSLKNGNISGQCPAGPLYSGHFTHHHTRGN